MLLVDLARRALDLTHFYANDGLLPNHTVLWRPRFEHEFSFFFVASHPLEAAVGMLACALAYGMLLVGVRTKLAQVLSLLCVISLHTRTNFVNNGGDVVLGELALLTAFLPMGRRFSLDALRARAAPETSPPEADASAPVVSFAVLVLTLQLAAIYLYNALNKTGPTWRGGTVVHYMLQQDGIVTSLGHWARGFIGIGESRVMTYASLGIEGALPILLLTPLARRFARSLAVVLVIALHGGFALFLNLGVFVPAMMAFALNFIPKEDWDALERVWARGGTLATRLGGALERFQVVARRWAPSKGRSESVLTRTLGPARVTLLREATVVALGCALGFQALIDNPAVTKLSAEHQPKFLGAIVSYLEALQAWGMYAPDAPTTDTNIYVDAITADGRHVDPFNEVASPEHPRPGPRVPAYLGQNTLFYAYALRIPWAEPYHAAFGEWILRYPERTGRARDRIASFEAFFVEDDSPPPGAREPSKTRVKSFLKFPTP